VNPIAIGSGIPLFQGWDGLRHGKLEENRSYSNGFVLQRYKLGRPVE
jgi:hypothetical protein